MFLYGKKQKNIEMRENMIYKKTESLIEQLKEQHDLEYLKNQFKNVYFIIGTAYAGKSTMVKMLSEYYDGITCEENYGLRFFKRM